MKMKKERKKKIKRNRIEVSIEFGNWHCNLLKMMLDNEMRPTNPPPTSFNPISQRLLPNGYIAFVLLEICINFMRLKDKYAYMHIWNMEKKIIIKRNTMFIEYNIEFKTEEEKSNWRTYKMDFFYVSSFSFCFFPNLSSFLIIEKCHFSFYYSILAIIADKRYSFCWLDLQIAFVRMCDVQWAYISFRSTKSRNQMDPYLIPQ